MFLFRSLFISYLLLFLPFESFGQSLGISGGGGAGVQICIDTGGDDTYICPALNTYRDNMMISFRASTANTGGATLNGKTITNNDGTALTDGKLSDLKGYTLFYNQADDTFRLPQDLIGDVSSGLTATGSTGIVVETSPGNTTARSVVAGSSKMSVENGSGTGGNISVDAVPANFNLQDFGGAITDTQAPNDLTIDLATNAAGLTDGDKGHFTCTSGVCALDSGVVTTGMLEFDSATQVELDTHKTSTDHDGRYYTETELSTDTTAEVHYGNVTNIPDLATQTELDTHKTSTDHDGRYYTEAELNTGDGVVNEAGDPIDWTKIKNIPAGFADGTDDLGGGGEGGSAPGGNPSEVQYQVDSSTFGGVSSMTSDGTVIMQLAGTNWSLLDPTDTSKALRFNVSAIDTSTIRTVTSPNADTVLVQPSTLSPGQFVTHIDSSGVQQKAPITTDPLFVATADGGVFGVTEATTLAGTGVGSLTTGAGFFTVGKTVNFRVAGLYTTDADDTIEITLTAEGTPVLTTGAFTATIQTGQEFTVDIEVVCQTTGATGDFQATGAATLTTGTVNNAAIRKPMVVASPFQLDTTGTIAWDVKVTPSSTATSLTSKTFVMYPGTGGSSALSTLTVEEEDGTPSVVGVTEIKVANTSLTDNGGGSVSIALGGGSGDSVSVDGIAVVDPDLVSTGDVDVVDTNNTITFNLNADVVGPAEMADADHGDVAWSGGVASVQNLQCTNCIGGTEIDESTLGDVPTATLATTATTANAGDSATAFFSTGTLENARLDADLATLGDNATNGLWTRTGAGTGAARTITGTSNEVSVANGDGVSGNPMLSLPATLNLSSKTVRVPNSTTLPGTCTVGDAYMDTDATTGQRWYLCEATNSWVLQGATSSGDITSVGDVTSGAAFDGTQGTILTFNNAGGDGTVDFDGTNFNLSHPLATGASATPRMDFRDSDATDGDINATITANAVVVTSGAEDIDVAWQQQVDGTLVNAFSSVADGAGTIGSSQNTAWTITTDGTGDGELTVPGSSIGAAELATDSVSADELNATGVEAELEAVLDLQELQGAVTDAQVPDTITASNYLPLAGGTLTGEVTVDDLGLEFTPGDALTDCSTFAVTGGGIFYDDSEAKFKKCQDNVLTDLDTTSTGGGYDTVDDEDTPLTQRTTINFAGAGVTCADDTDQTTCTIPGGGAPTDVNYLVGTASGSLSAEIVVGTSPGGELGGTWGSPTIDDGLTVANWTLTSPVISSISNTGTLTLPTSTDTLVGRATTDTLTNKTIDSAGTGNAITIPDIRWFDVAGCANATAGHVFDAPTANAAAPTCDTGTNTQKGYLAFDAATDESIQGKFRLPAGFQAGINFIIRWKAAATTGAAGFCVQLVRVPVGATSDPAFPAQAAGNCVSVTAQGTTLQENEATITGATCTSCVAGDLVYFRLSRDADASAVTDDMTGDALVLGFERSFNVVH